MEEIADLRLALMHNMDRARAELLRHVRELRMIPHDDEHGRCYEVHGDILFGTKSAFLMNLSSDDSGGLQSTEDEKDQLVLAQADPKLLSDGCGAVQPSEDHVCNQ